MLASLALRIGAYAASHRPSAFAASTASCPGARIRPSPTSRATCSRFTWLQMLFRRLGVKRWRNDSSSSPFLSPSIHPQQSAESSASA